MQSARTLARARGSISRAMSTSPSGLVPRLEQLLGRDAVLTQGDSMDKYCRDWLGQYGERALAVVRPNSTEQVAAVVRACSELKVPLVPQGGNTGLVGGSVPRSGEVLLSLERMHSVRFFDQDSNVLVAEAGCRLQETDEWLRREHSRCIPLDLAAKGSCTLGGNVSTAAGGVHVVRWGGLHSSVLGVEAVLADGTVVDGIRTARKSNTGYHWSHLFVGAEGTLGIVTAVALAVPPAPRNRAVAMVGCADWEGVRRLVHRALGPDGLAETISALEYLDAGSVDMAVTWGGARDPLDERYPYTVLLEAASADLSSCSQRLEHVVQSAIVAEEAVTGVIASSTQQERELWAVRESVTLALTKRGAGVKLDVSVPLSRMAGPEGAVVAARRHLANELPPGWLSNATSADFESLCGAGWNGGVDEGGVCVVGYGHVGDGNLHLNASIPSLRKARGMPEGREDALFAGAVAWTPPQLADAHSRVGAALLPWVPQWITEHGGRGASVSAEHGVGVSKLSYAGLSRGEGEELLMRRLKAALDPLNLLNPGRVMTSDH
jgi:(R)-2-hydroxyglutarate---pyruvate transhydrogenase